MKSGVVLVVLLSAALGSVGCASVGKAPDCKGKYTPVNPANCYTVPANADPARPAPTVCPVVVDGNGGAVAHPLEGFK